MRRAVVGRPATFVPPGRFFVVGFSPVLLPGLELGAPLDVLVVPALGS